MKKIFTLPLFLCLCFIAFSQTIDVNLAKSYAEKWLMLSEQKALNNLECVYTKSDEAKSQSYFYIFNSKANNIFVIVSADERILPILAYSDEGSFDPDNFPPNMQSWLNGYVNEMNYIFSLPDIAKHPEWDNITNGVIVRGTTEVAPLINLRWNQPAPYNALCPGGSVAGCVATAMSMIMKYWNHPVHGYGQSSYYCSPWGVLSANYGETYYQWDQMPVKLTSSSPQAQKDAVAILTYHCGVSVEMNYGINASGAWTENVVDALINYFGYKPQCTMQYRDDYTDAQWENMMKNELNAGRPMEYKGYDEDGQGGHAFILDGYNTANKFHFNWGWGGSSNGYFTLADLNPGQYHFNDWQGAVMHIEPIRNLYCNPPTNLTVNYTSDCKAELRWNAPAGETPLYNIYRDGTLIESNVTTTSYTDEEFNNLVGHTWFVKIVCSTEGEAYADVTKGACNSITAVTNIIDLPTTATIGTPLTLTGTVVPSDATNQEIIWSIAYANGTGATISDGNIFNATASGVASVRATILKGLATGQNYTKDFTITVNPRAQLTGSVTIIGDAVLGKTLTANTSELTSTPVSDLGALTYEWKRENTPIGSNNPTYTLVKEDLNNTITVTISAANCNGSIVSSPTAPVSDPNGIEEPEFAKVHIYSYQNAVHIKNETGITLKSIEIMDMLGRIVYQSATANVETIIPLQVKNGIYTVRLISSDDQFYVAKVLILK